jgi:hypothetical protein
MDTAPVTLCEITADTVIAVVRLSVADGRRGGGAGVAAGASRRLTVPASPGGSVCE